MTLPRGFSFSGVHAGIKPFKKDLALVASETPCAAAAALTVNRARAAPLQHMAKLMPNAGLRAVLLNSGNANALTGTVGLEDVQLLCAQTEAALGVGAGTVVMASTGVIGQRLPVAKISATLPALVAGLAAAPELAAEAILTTDTRIKLSSRDVELGGVEGHLFGFCKGSGMIAPQLATVLAVVCTDLAIAPDDLQQTLVAAMGGSFNNLNVDNDMSPNDVVVVLANGRAQNAPLSAAELARFQESLASVCAELAREVARDGEGATKLLEVRISGAPTAEAAADLARSVVGSTLVKSAVFGADPNWGRILATVGARAGSRGFAIDPERSKVSVQGFAVYDCGPLLDLGAEREIRGDGSLPPLARLKARMRAPEVLIEVELGQGAHASTAWGCDLSYDYVKLNADYTSLLHAKPDGSLAKDERLTSYSPHFKVTLVTQALNYIARFAGKRVVVALGTEALETESRKVAITEDVRLLRSAGMVPILVHAERAASDGSHSARANVDLVTLLNRKGVDAIGLSGMDASFLRCSRGAPGELGKVESVNSGLLEMFLEKKYLPVVSAVGLLEDGSLSLLDVDETAARIATAVHAAKLVYLAGFPGFVVADELIAQFSPELLAKYIAAGGFQPELSRKATWALSAIEGGVEQVHLVDARAPHSIIAEFFTERGIGSMVARGL